MPHPLHHLRYRGFTFAVLPREFLVHLPHPKSPAKVHWLRDGATHRGVDRQFQAFMRELGRTYGGPATHVCDAQSRRSGGGMRQRRRRRE